MLARSIVVALLLTTASSVGAEPPSFERRVVAILNAGGPPNVVQSRLDRVGEGISLSSDQRIAIDAVRKLVRSKAKAKGPSLTEAEAFAARNPNSPASAFLLAEAALANDQPERSADTFIASAGRAGSLVELVSPATVSKLTADLDKKADRKRIADVGKALLASGWSRGSASLRSYLALAAIRDDLGAGKVDQARRFLPAIISPASLHMILIDNRLAPLRAEVEKRAGPRLEKAWRDFLTRTRDEWIERGDALSASAFVEALKQANRHEQLADAFLARFMRGYNCPSDLVARTIAPALAESLAKVGRWSRAEDVMRRSGGVSAVTYGSMLLERGEFGRAAALFDRSLKAARAPDDADERKATAWLDAASGCAASRGARSTQSRYDLKLLDVSARMFALLCTDRTAEARDTIVAALDDEQERADALRWVQPFADPPVQSAFRKDMSARIRAIQRDPAVLRVVVRYGTILDWSLTSAAPAAAELPAGPKATSWRCGDDASWQLATVPGSTRPPDKQP